jgi:hypothetical protein
MEMYAGGLIDHIFRVFFGFGLFCLLDPDRRSGAPTVYSVLLTGVFERLVSATGKCSQVLYSS